MFYFQALFMKEIPMNEAWILGGSSGLGYELVQEAVRRGITPLVFGRKADRQVDLADRGSVAVLCKTIDEMDESALNPMSFFIWNASILEYAKFDGMKNTSRMLDINVLHPTLVLRSLIARKKFFHSPFHLITVSSVASWKARPEMAVYCGSKAYQAQFSRALALDLERDLPGSKVTIVLPAGMKTNLFHETDVNTSEFMEPRLVAEIIWNQALTQTKFYDEFNILRQGAQPVVSREMFAPELAYDDLPRYNRRSS